MEREHRLSCPRCGGDVEWQECEEIDCDDGQVSLYEEDPLWYDEGDTEPCQTCDGQGGWWHCVNTREWCVANALVPMTDEALRDALDALMLHA